MLWIINDALNSESHSPLLQSGWRHWHAERSKHSHGQREGDYQSNGHDEEAEAGGDLLHSRIETVVDDRGQQVTGRLNDTDARKQHTYTVVEESIVCTALAGMGYVIHMYNYSDRCTWMHFMECNEGQINGIRCSDITSSAHNVLHAYIDSYFGRYHVRHCSCLLLTFYWLLSCTVSTPVYNIAQQYTLPLHLLWGTNLHCRVQPLN